MTEDFEKLYKELVAEGMFKPSIGHVVYRISELTVLATFGVFCLMQDTLPLKILGLFSFAMFQGRSGWLMHEGGHHSLTGNSTVDRFLQVLILGKIKQDCGKLNLNKIPSPVVFRIWTWDVVFLVVEPA